MKRVSLIAASAVVGALVRGGGSYRRARYVAEFLRDPGATLRDSQLFPNCSRLCPR